MVVEMPDNLSGFSLDPYLPPTGTVSIELGSVARDCLDGPASGGLETMTSWAGLKAILEEKCHTKWVFRKPKFSFRPLLSDELDTG